MQAWDAWDAAGAHAHALCRARREGHLCRTRRRRPARRSLGRMPGAEGARLASRGSAREDRQSVGGSPRLNLTPDEAEQAVAKVARDFATRELAPRAAARDR